MAPPGLSSEQVQVKLRSKPIRNFDLRNTAHQTTPRDACIECKQDFHRKCQARKPLLFNETESNSLCNKCDSTFGPGCVLDKHVESVLCERLALLEANDSPSEPIKHQCKQCKLSFGSQEVLKIHVANVHRELKAELILETVICTDCGLEFQDKSTLEEHAKAVHDHEQTTALPERESICQHCDELNKFKQNFLRVMQAISNKLTDSKCEELRDNCKDKLSCNECDENLDVLLKHITEKHTRSSKNQPKPKEEPNVDDQVKESPVLDTLENEELSDHNDNDNLSDPDYTVDDNEHETNPEPMAFANADNKVMEEESLENPGYDSLTSEVSPGLAKGQPITKGSNCKTKYVRKTVTCKLCGKTFKGNHSLKVHTKTVHNDGGGFRCKLCDLDFSSTKELRIHNKSANDKMKAFHKCPQCGKTLEGALTLYRHIQGVHQKIRKSQCDKCAQTFFNQSNLANHIKAVHGDNQRLFICDAPNCGKSFKIKLSLKKHTTDVHERVKKFQCYKCAKSFTREETLRNHVAVIHDKTAKHKCRHCGMGFTCKYSLTRHVEARHENKRKHQCDKCGSSYNYATLLEKHMKAVHKMGLDEKETEPPANKNWGYSPE